LAYYFCAQFVTVSESVNVNTTTTFWCIWI